jgi:hypothetical protein
LYAATHALSRSQRILARVTVRLRRTENPSQALADTFPRTTKYLAQPIFCYSSTRRWTKHAAEILEATPLTELLRLSMANDYNERHQCHNESHQRYLTNISAFTKGSTAWPASCACGLPQAARVAKRLSSLWFEFADYGAEFVRFARNFSALKCLYDLCAVLQD